MKVLGKPGDRGLIQLASWEATLPASAAAGATRVWVVETGVVFNLGLV